MEEKADSKRPENTPFKQQRLPAWQPLLTPMYVIGTFVVVGFIFLPIGIVILTESNNVVEYKARYDNLPSCQLLTNERSKTCNVSITIDEHMKRPIYVYYELSNYYQNHRRYVKSRSDQQLRGDLGTGTALCDPIERDVNGSIIVACGLVANSFFNDTFSATVCNSTSRCAPLTGNNWLKKGIAWKSDVEEKFKAVPLPATGFTNISVDGFPLPSVADEDFIVWMRTAGLPRFRKLYRKIEDMDLVASQTITFNVVNRYPVDSFDGTKSIVISTTSWLGGKNNFLGWAYIVVGALCLLMALAFEIRSLAAPRLLGDMKYFDWSGSSVAKTDAEH